LLSRDENPADRRQHREGGLLKRSVHFQQKKFTDGAGLSIAFSFPL
jgi:hypothetical protein